MVYLYDNHNTRNNNILWAAADELFRTKYVSHARRNNKIKY